MRSTFRLRLFILWWSATIAQTRVATSWSDRLDSSSSYNNNHRILQDSSIITMEDPTNWCLDTAFNCDCSVSGVISNCLRNEDCDKCADENSIDDSSTTAAATAPCLTTTSSAILLNDNIDYDATTCHSFDNHSWSLCTTQSVRTTSLVETSCEFTYNEQVFCCTTTTTSSCGVEFCKGTSLEGLDICLLLTMECPRLQPVTTTLAPSSSQVPTAAVVATASPAPTVVSSNETIAGNSMNDDDDDDENESDENENNTTSALLFEMEWPAQGLDCSANDEQDSTTDTICGDLDLESSEGVWYKLTGTGKYLEWTPTCTNMEAAALMGNLTVTVLAGNSCDVLDCILPPQSMDMAAAVCTNYSKEDGGDDDDDDDDDSQGTSTIEIRQRGRRSIRRRQLQAIMNDLIPNTITIQTKAGVLYWIYVEGDDDAQEVLLQDFPFEIGEFVPEDEETKTTPAPSTIGTTRTVVVSPSPTSNPTTTTAPTIMPSSTGTSPDNDDANSHASSSLSTGAIIGIVVAALLLCCYCCILLLGVYARRNQDDDPEERNNEEAANHNDDDDDDKSSTADSESDAPEEEDWDEEET